MRVTSIIQRRLPDALALRQKIGLLLDMLQSWVAAKPRCASKASGRRKAHRLDHSLPTNTHYIRTAIHNFMPTISVEEPEEIVSVRRRQHDLILQVCQSEHRQVRDIRPVQQIRTLLQGEIQGRNDP